MNFLELLFPILVGIGSQHIMQGAKAVSGFVDRAPAPIKQMGVLSIAAGVTWASQYVPGLDRIVSLSDPNLAAGIAAATAYGTHRPGNAGPRL